jgi:WD40 repeat protein
MFKESIMKWLQKCSVLVFIFFLISCSFTGKPNIRLNAGGVEMELTRPVPLGVSMDYSPNGKYIAIGGWGDGGITVWDIVNGLQIGTFATDSNTRFGIPMGVHVAFSPNGSNLVSVGKDIKLWDMPSGREIRTIGHKSLYQIVVSNDGNKFLATETIPLSNANPDMVLWDIKTGTEIKKFIVPFSLGLPVCIALSPDGKYALSGHVPGGGFQALKKLANIVLWDAETGEALKVVRASDTPGVYFVAFSSDGKYARSGGTDGTIRLWEIPSLKEIKTFKAHTQLASSSAISPNGKI